MYPPHSSHESVRYWNAGWFYVKNIEVPNVHKGLPKFVNEPPEELDSWSLIPALAQYPELNRAARRISRLVHDGLTGTDLMLSWFSRRIDPLKYNSRKICEYTGVDDPLRVTRDNLPADSLKRRIKTLVKVTRGQPVPEIGMDIKTNNECPPLDTLAGEDFKTNLREPLSHDQVEEDPEDDDEKEEQAPKKAAPRLAKRPRTKASGSEAGASGEASAKKAKTEQQTLHYELHKNISLQRRVTLSQAEDIQAGKEKIAELEKQLAEAQNASTSLATASSELESLRSAYQNLETELAEANKKREWAEKQLEEKNSELLQKEADFVQKRQVDSDTMQKLQKEVNSLWNYMTVVEKGWDLLNSDVMEPLGYNEERRSEIPRDDLIRLAGDDCQDLISACRKICHNLNIKDSRTCDINELIKRVDMLPELVVDLQASSARGATCMSLAMCLARSPGLDLDVTTTGVPPNTDVNALLDACSGYDTRIARRIPHTGFYNKVVLPADELLEAEYAKEREAEAQPVGSGDEGQVTWTCSKDKSKDGATSLTKGAEDDDDDEDVGSSPAKEAECETAQTEDGAGSSPTEEK
ncbi:hypothetical protein QYE76_027294 [Lolium multiflorum]|uniref:Uncharacterized protein n=1 Tax=Lolium multiflorum TaxID=4521 RepID=A0AAD8VFX0_LOLMU|nr:hypothetical protein QYE76_027294 [Lolium multiflorum]